MYCSTHRRCIITAVLLLLVLVCGCTMEVPEPCAADQKLCANHCVSIDDPAFGCAPDICAPCALGHADAVCAAGACAITTCTEGWADCDLEPQTGCERHLLTDPDHCNRCGRSCPTCEQGSCQPILVATNQDGPCTVTVDHQDIYWTNYMSGQLMRAPLEGGDPVEVATGQQQPWFILLDASYVFWSNRQGPTIARAPKGGGAVEIFIPDDLVKPAGLSVDNWNVYWADANGGKVEKASRTDGSDRLTLASGLAYPWEAAARDSYLYFSDQEGGTVHKVHAWGKESAVVMTAGLSRLSGLTVDDTHVYWLDDDENGLGRVMRISRDAPEDGAQPQLLFEETGFPYMIVVDGDYVYWTNSDAGTVNRIVKDGSEQVATVLAAGQANPVGIAVDATFVYWAEHYGASIWKVAK